MEGVDMGSGASYMIICFKGACMTCGVYEIVNKVNGKRYVGSSVSIEGRWAQHRSSLRHKKHHSPYLQRAWDKYGGDMFEWNVITECQECDVLSIEQSEIDNKSEYNIAPLAGRSSGHRWTEEQKLAHSKSKREYFSTPENRRKLDENRSRHNTDEVRSAISAGTIRGQSDPSVRKRMSDAGKANWTDERKAAASIIAKEKISRPEHIAAIISANSGVKNSNYNHTIYNFTHPEHGDVDCTQWDLRKKYGLRHSNLSQVCSGQKGSHKGWRIKKGPN